MTEHVDKMVAQALEQLRKQESEVTATKKLINGVLAFDGRPPMFAEIESPTSAVALRGDEYYGQKQSSACRLVLERRKAMNLGPATLDEIFAALTEGGYRHEAKNEEVAKRSIYGMLVQNSAIFHRLPTGKFGLNSWYPNAKKPRAHTMVNEPTRTPSSDLDGAAEGEAT